MSELVHVVGYTVDRCGYYRRGQPDPAFGEFPAVGPELAAWLRHKPIAETCTELEAEEGEEEHEGLLCVDHAETRGDWLFQMWQRTTGDGGEIGTIPGNALVGRATATPARLRGDGIMGAARLFWLVPELNMLCTVRIGRTRATAVSAFQRYMRDFLVARADQWVRTEEGEDGSVSVIGYAEGDDEPESYIPGFRVVVAPDASAVAIARRQRARIRSVLYRGRMPVLTARRKLGPIDRLMERMVQDAPSSLDDPTFVRMSAEVRFTPDQNELEALIAAGGDATGGVASDVGFRIEGHSGVLWIKGQRARLRDSIEVPRADGTQVDVGQFLTSLRRRFRAKLEAAVETA